MKKILVRGPILTRSGYGEHVRFLLRSLRKHQDRFDIYAMNTNWGQTGWLYRDDEERRWLDYILYKTMQHTSEGGQFDMSAQVTIPNEWEPLAPVNIGVTAGIETTKVSPQWIEKSMVVSKIIVPSEHSKKTYEETSYEATERETGRKIQDFRAQCPIEVVPYPVRVFEPEPLDLELKYDFNFLVNAQWGPRKNLNETIKYFVEEFYDKEVGIVLKVSIKNNSLIDYSHTQKELERVLEQYKGRKCAVHLLHGDLTEGQLAALYTDPKIKALVSFTRGEGYGLPLFEAAYYGLPVVTAGWSGHCDFLYKKKTVVTKKKGKTKTKVIKTPLFAEVAYELKEIDQVARWEGVLQPDSQWAYIQQGSAKMKLRDVNNNYKKYKKMADELKVWVRKEFEEGKILDLFADSIYKPSQEEEEWQEAVNSVEGL